MIVNILSLTHFRKEGFMKYSEFFKLIKRNGWKILRQGKGSHEIWQKDGQKVVIPNHGAKEIPTGLEKSLRKEMGL
jgi:predicted RNA binding protein YcfA (HicA-like mRNA interferase family)